MWREFVSRFKRSKVTLFWLYIPTTCLIFAVAVASNYLNIPVSYFTRDPMAVTGGHPFVGMISNIGVILWSFSVAICFFTYGLLKTSRKASDVVSFILFGGFIGLILLLDDLFMLHEYIYRIYFGLSEKFVLAFYGSLILFYLVNFRKVITETNFVYVVLAVFFFALSVMVDLLPEDILPWHHLIEDGPKLFGIVSWFGYQFSVCFQEAKSLSAL